VRGVPQLGQISAPAGAGAGGADTVVGIGGGATIVAAPPIRAPHVSQ
jgi:hypothetical protein